MSLILMAVAWMVGVYLADHYHLTQPIIVIGVGIGSLGLFIHRPRQVHYLLLIILSLSGGFWRYHHAQPETQANSVWRFNEQGEIALQGLVIEDSRRNGLGQRLLIRAERIRINGRVGQVQGLVQVQIPAYPVRRYGDRVLLIGTLETPREAKQPGTFDYKQYLARKQIFSIMNPTAVQLIAEEQGNPIWNGLLKKRDLAQKVLMRSLPEPQASLANGILLGLQAGISDELTHAFTVTGTSHVLVLSGWNITIISTMLYAFTDRFKIPKKKAFWLIIFCIWLYTMFVGAATTVVRAAIMGTLVVIGQRIDRPAFAWSTLFAACWVMTIWDPQILWDLGFQLSALATASLFAYGKPTEQWLKSTWLGSRYLGWARETLTATFAAQVLALPLILYHFGNLSIIAPISNVFLLPAVPYAMLFGAISILAGWIWLPLGGYVSPLAYFFLAWMTEGAIFFANIPYAAIVLPRFPLGLLVSYYVLVGGTWLWNSYVDSVTGGENTQ